MSAVRYASATRISHRAPTLRRVIDDAVPGTWQLCWRHPSPAALAGILESLGCAVDRVPDPGASVVTDLGGLLAEIVGVDNTGGEQLAFAGRRIERPPGLPVPAARLLALGVATVDAERWAAQATGLEPHRKATDARLGGRGFVIGTQPPRLLVLEPAREGPLAAALSRFGEGPTAIYISPRPASVPTDRSGERGWANSHLLRPERRWGPFVLLAEGG